MMSLEDLRVVMAVARHGSFVAAARGTRVPTSTVSRAVARFEAAARVRLFQRTSRHVSLTDEGSRLLERAAPLLDALEDVIANVSDDSSVVAGRLRVTAPVVSGAREIGAALLGYAEAHPHVVLELSLTNAVVDLIADAIDLAFRAGPVVTGADLVARRIHSVPFAIGASRAFVRRELRGRRAIDLAALESVSAVVAAPGTTWRFRRTEGSTVEVRPRGRLFVNDPRVALDAARRGMGLIRAPRDWISDAELVVLEPTDAVGVPEPRDLFAVYPSRHFVPKRVSLAVAWVERELGARSPKG